MNRTRAWKGLLKRAEDNFDSGTDQDLTAAGWTKINGTASIREDGTSKAYSTSALSAQADYTINMYPLYSTKQWRSRWVRCKFLVLSNTTVMALYHSVSYSSGRRTGMWVQAVRNSGTGIWTFTYSAEFNGGGVSSTAVGTINETIYTPPYTVLMRTHGSLIDIDVGQGDIVGGDGLISLASQSVVTQFTTNRPGLLYIGPAFGLGGHEAEWSEFLVRQYPV